MGLAGRDGDTASRNGDVCHVAAVRVPDSLFNNAGANLFLARDGGGTRAAG
jgi:hypothetical protein